MMSNPTTRVSTPTTRLSANGNINNCSSGNTVARDSLTSTSNSARSASPSPPLKLIRDILHDVKLKKDSSHTMAKNILNTNNDQQSGENNDIEMNESIEKTTLLDNLKVLPHVNTIYSPSTTNFASTVPNNSATTTKLATVLIEGGNTLQFQLKPDGIKINPIKKSNDHGPIILNSNSLSLAALARHQNQQQSTNTTENNSTTATPGTAKPPLEIITTTAATDTAITTPATHHHHHHQNSVYLITTPIDLLATSAQVLQQQQNLQQQQHSLKLPITTTSNIITNPKLYTLATNTGAGVVTATAPGSTTNSTNNVTTVTLTSPQSSMSTSSASMSPTTVAPSQQQQQQLQSYQNIPVSTNPFAGQRGVRDEKRRANHNEVERRRRDNINKWIGELSKVIPDCNGEPFKLGHGKLTKENKSKGGILEKTVQYVMEMKIQNHMLAEKLKLMENLFEDLKEQNELMRQENELLKQKMLLLQADNNNNIIIDTPAVATNTIITISSNSKQENGESSHTHTENTTTD